jgi:hypothetical protein
MTDNTMQYKEQGKKGQTMTGNTKNKGKQEKQ